MAEQVQAWRAKDGSLHETEQAANAVDVYEALITGVDVWLERVASYGEISASSVESPIGGSANCSF